MAFFPDDVTDETDDEPPHGHDGKQDQPGAQQRVVVANQSLLRAHRLALGADFNEFHRLSAPGL